MIEKKSVGDIADKVSSSFEAAVIFYLLEARTQKHLLKESEGPILWTDIDYENYGRGSFTIYEESSEPVRSIHIFSVSATGEIGKYLNQGDDFTVTVDKALPADETDTYSNIIRIKRIPTEIEPTLYVQHVLESGENYTLPLNLLSNIGKNEFSQDALKSEGLVEVELELLVDQVTKMTSTLNKLNALDAEFDWNKVIEYPVAEDTTRSLSVTTLVDILKKDLNRIRDINHDLFKLGKMNSMNISVVEKAEKLLRELPEKPSAL